VTISESPLLYVFCHFSFLEELSYALNLLRSAMDPFLYYAGSAFGCLSLAKTMSQHT
jgi:hypothetical protein